MKANYVIDTDLLNEISQFYYREAELLDQRNFQAWFALLSEEIIYRMPVRVTREISDGSDVVNEMSFYEDDYVTMKTRVDRLGTKSAWSHIPPSRTRHFVSNFLIEKGKLKNELKVKSYFQFIRSRGNQPTNDQVTGERNDILRKVDDDWKIVSRTIYPDQAVIGTLNLNNFF